MTVGSLIKNLNHYFLPIDLIHIHQLNGINLLRAFIFFK